MLQDALHAVVMLLPSGAQVFLQGSCHGWEDGLCSLPGIHHLPWSFLLLFHLEALDVSESLFNSHHKPAQRKRTAQFTTKEVRLVQAYSTAQESSAWASMSSSTAKSLHNTK